MELSGSAVKQSRVFVYVGVRLWERMKLIYFQINGLVL